MSRNVLYSFGLVLLVTAALAAAFNWSLIKGLLGL